MGFFTAARGLDGGTFGNSLIPSILAVQFDHRGLALLGDVGAQARYFATVREVRHRERLAANDAAANSEHDGEDQTDRCGDEPGEAAIAPYWL